MTYKKLSRLEDSIAAYRECIKINPKNIKALCNLGAIYYSQEKMPEAKDYFKQALEIKKNYDLCHFNLGLIYKREHNLAEAKYQFRQALDLGYEGAQKQLDALEHSVPETSARPNIPALPGHSGKITALALTPDGKYAFSASLDKTVRVWDLPWRKLIHTLHGCSENILSIAIQDEAKWIVCASAEGSIKGSFLDGNQLHEITKLPKPRAVILMEEGQKIVYVDQYNQVQIFDVSENTHALLFKAEPGEITCLSYSPNSDLLLIAYIENRIAFWSSSDKMKTHDHKTPSPVTSMLVTPGGMKVIYGCEDGTITVLNSFSGLIQHALTGHKKRVNALDCGKQGKRLISVSDDCSLKVWDLSNGNLTNNISFGSALTSCQITHDGINFLIGDTEGHLYAHSLKDLSDDSK